MIRYIRLWRYYLPLYIVTAAFILFNVLIAFIPFIRLELDKIFLLKIWRISILSIFWTFNGLSAFVYVLNRLNDSVDAAVALNDGRTVGYLNEFARHAIEYRLLRAMLSIVVIFVGFASIASNILSRFAHFVSDEIIIGLLAIPFIILIKSYVEDEQEKSLVVESMRRDRRSTDVKVDANETDRRKTSKS